MRLRYKNIKRKATRAVFLLYVQKRILSVEVVRYGQSLSAFGTTGSQYATTVGGSHSGTEAVFVFLLSVRGLKCSFHCRYILCYLFREKIRSAKIETFFE